MRKVVYLATGFKGHDRKQVNAIIDAWMEYAIERGYAPHAPWLRYVDVLDDNKPSDRQIGIECDYALIRASDELWVVGAPQKSSSAWIEASYAKRHGVKVVELNSSILPPLD